MCTRATYLGPDDTVITTRSLDWTNPMDSNVWVFPRGMDRTGAAGPGSFTWTSHYGSVISSGFEAVSVDGINERGLVTSLLYLAESDYGVPAHDDPRRPMSISAWSQFVLDTFATVDEAVTALRQEPFYVVAVMTPDGYPGVGHLAISDQSGDSAIFEYIDGKLEIHHGREYQVMTNSPIFREQLALNAYWQQIGGSTMLPGTQRAADRFVRASFYIKAVPQTADITRALASAFSVIRNVSVPLGISTPDEPNVASTLWRTVVDHKNRVYYFESTQSPYLLWLNLDELDFSEGAPTLRLGLTEEAALVRDGDFVSGNARDFLAPAEPFLFLEATPPAPAA